MAINLIVLQPLVALIAGILILMIRNYSPRYGHRLG